MYCIVGCYFVASVPEPPWPPTRGQTRFAFQPTATTQKPFLAWLAGAHGYSRRSTSWRDGGCPAAACCWCWRGSRRAARRRGGDSIASGRAPAARPETQMTHSGVGYRQIPTERARTHTAVEENNLTGVLKLKMYKSLEWQTQARCIYINSLLLI